MWDELAAEAARTGVTRAPSPENPFNLGPGSLFSHYASSTLRPNQRVMATTASLDDTPYGETSVILQPLLLRALLALARDGASLEELVSAADAPAGHAWYGLTWLLKYGLLRLA
jgi:hypothetical protein